MLNFFICLFALSIIRNNMDLSRYRYLQSDILKSLPFYWIGGILLALDIVLDKGWQIIPDAGWLVLLTYLIYFLKEEKEQPLAGSLLRAGFPYYLHFLILFVVKYLIPPLYKTLDPYLDIASMVTTVWLLAFGISANNQLKNLKREKEQKEQVISQNEMLEKLVQERTTEILLQKNQLQEALEELQQTQNQLIQQEKLASLGELTAGIAHEIQNPLNFVNNFSEVSSELAEELREELEGTALPESAQEILEDLVQNLGKITHHGKRASGIVRNMLEHSRASTGERQEVDVNTLAEEYLKLSFHGLRAKDKSFNSDFKVIPEQGLPMVNAIPQDLGRVILNLCNNAFYAVSKKKGEPNFKPVVTLTTRLDAERDAIAIEITDNGDGIPYELQNKIFQPFFTTKPTGQGTGLGLSLSYDIITKGHSGELLLQSTPGEGTKFTIYLPL